MGIFPRWFLIAFFVGGGAYAFAQSHSEARAIMEKAAQMRLVDSSEGVSTLTIINNRGQERVRKVAMITKLYDNGKTEKRLVRFLSPADVKGTGLLTYDYERDDDAMWLYLPALRKSRRLVSREKSKSFMGSEFSYADMNIPDLDDFQLTLEGEETVDGALCSRIAQIPKNDDLADELGFAKRISWVGKDDYVIRKAEYFDTEGERFKVLTTKDVRLIDPKAKRYRPMHMRMENLKTGRSSLLVIDKLEVNTKVGDDYFTPRFLERE